MAKPYRRKKNKKFVGNWRVTVGGKDINLETKDFREAELRARLAVKGEWPPTDAAARAAASVLDPATESGAPGPNAGTSPVAESPEEQQRQGGGDGTAVKPVLSAASNGKSQQDVSEGAPEALHEAAAAAAAEAAGTDADNDAAVADVANDANAAVKAAMGELIGPNGDLTDEAADGVAAFLLWAQGKAIELGVKWTLEKSIQVGQPEPGSNARKVLRVGVKACALKYAPNLAQNLSPAWAIAAGLALGAIDQMKDAVLLEDAPAAG